ncbi:MAG TPA: ABC transporter permease [Bacteroidetes bacterium]|nr:ABC transporter permease [Bacteroidota bacterium]
MNKIILIIKREYLSRVKKKSFIIMTLLAPLLMAAMLIIPFWMMSQGDDTEKDIAVVEEGTSLFTGVIPDTKTMRFHYLEDARMEELKTTFSDLGYYGVLYVSPKQALVPGSVEFWCKQQPPLEVTMHISNALEKEIERLKLETYNISNLDEILASVETSIQIQTFKVSDTGEVKKSNTGITMGIAYISGFLIYMFTFMFGAQVMRGVIEEKTSRIVEVIVSSVKPFQLMLGKIVGIALVGLTQFVSWVVLTGVIVSIAQSMFLPDNMMEQIQSGQSIMSAAPAAAQASSTIQMTEAQRFIESIYSVEWGLIILTFIAYFMGGYLLYASLFAIVGSAVDNETDTQQFMLPITIPMILGLFVMLNAFQNPNSSIAFWFSLIPFTSPIVMMARIPFGVPAWELGTSLLLLVMTFILTTWMAGKIYRTGILMYGKKVSYKELWKWLRYKN